MSVLKPEGRLRYSLNNKDCCNDPNLWHSREGGSTEQEVAELLAGFVRALQPELVVETGCQYGFTTQILGTALKRNGHGKLVGIDTGEKKCRDATVRCEDLPVIIQNMSSLDWIPNDGEVIGFLYSDSSLEARLSEFDHFRRFIKSSTVIAWHDTGTSHRSSIQLKEYIRGLSDKGLIQPLFLPTPRGICFARVLKDELS